MYSLDFKKRTVEYCLENHTIKETTKIFKISRTTLNRWIKELKVTGELKAEYDSSNRTFKKIDPEKFKEYIKENSDALQKEMATHFSCCRKSITKLMGKLGITRKKRQNFIKNAAKGNVTNS
jgi:transposase